MSKELSSSYRNCLCCVFFRTSWDASKSRECSLFGFKSRKMPSEIVYEVSGIACPHFRDKFKKDKNKGGR